MLTAAFVWGKDHCMKFFCVTGGMAESAGIRRKEVRMRRFEEGQPRALTQVVCNMCGRELRLENGYLREGCFSGDVLFGYFSRRDGISHHFDLCEDCYDKVIARFRVPVEENEGTELV